MPRACGIAIWGAVPRRRGPGSWGGVRVTGVRRFPWVRQGRKPWPALAPAERQRQQAAGLGQVRIQAQGGAIRFHRISAPPLCGQRATETEVRVRKVGPDRQRTAELVLGVREASRAQQDIAQIEARVGVGRDPGPTCGGSAARPRRGRRTGAGVHAEVVVRLDEVRPQVESTPVALHRAGGAPRSSPARSRAGSAQKHGPVRCAPRPPGAGSLRPPARPRTDRCRRAPGARRCRARRPARACDPASTTCATCRDTSRTRVGRFAGIRPAAPAASAPPSRPSIAVPNRTSARRAARGCSDCAPSCRTRSASPTTVPAGRRTGSDVAVLVLPGEVPVVDANQRPAGARRQDRVGFHLPGEKMRVRIDGQQIHVGRQSIPCPPRRGADAPAGMSMVWDPSCTTAGVAAGAVSAKKNPTETWTGVGSPRGTRWVLSTRSVPGSSRHARWSATSFGTVPGAQPRKWPSGERARSTWRSS